MTRDDLVDFISDQLITASGQFNGKRAEKYKDYFSLIKCGDTLNEKAYLVCNNLESPPVCSCGKPLTYNGFSKGYANWCSTKCMSKSEDIRNKKKNTCMDRYGVSSSVELSSAKDALSEFFSTSDRVEKAAEKRKQTTLERYGTDHHSRSEDVKQKTKDTCLEKYGSEFFVTTAEFKEKSKNTCREKYGVDHITQTEWFKKTSKNTCISNYGVDNPSKSPELKNKKAESRRQSFYEGLATRVTDCVPMFSLSEYHRHSDAMRWECNSCGNEFIDNLVNGSVPICKECNPGMVRTSTGEKEVADYLEQYTRVVRNTYDVIGPYELDIYLPDLNAAVEYCGLYWHSDKVRPDPNFHVNKMNRCNDSGIRLITLFEDEWLHKRDVCERRLQHLAKSSKTICYARQCYISEIHAKQYRNFLETYHIQGYVPAKYKLGAWYKGDLVAVMSFSKRAMLKNDTYELMRYATSGNIPGIANRLFKYYLRNLHPGGDLISYCDLRWGTGDVYEKLGFEFVSNSGPGYWYTRDYRSREHRYNYRKMDLVAAGHDPNKTEREIMLELGFAKVYDCGNNKYIYREK